MRITLAVWRRRWRDFWHGIESGFPLCCVVRFSCSKWGDQALVRGRCEDERGPWVACDVFHHGEPWDFEMFPQVRGPGTFRSMVAFDLAMGWTPAASGPMTWREIARAIRWRLLPWVGWWKDGHDQEERDRP